MAYYNLGESFNWFVGRVVKLDPEEEKQTQRYLGRVKVRVLHDQTGELGKVEGTYGINDEDLLWAWPLSSIQSSSLSYRKIVELEKFETPFWIDAVGTSPTGIAIGTYVFGFYLDGHEANIPIIFGTYHKNSLYPEPPTDKATGEMLQVDVPTEEYEYMDVSALAKGWWSDKQRVANHPLGQDYEAEIAPEVGGQLLPKHPYNSGKLGLVKQPPSDYDTKYPYNLVHTTKSGHAIEIDDTPGHERVHIWHRSGSYEEISNGPPEQNRDGLKGAYPQNMGPNAWEEPDYSHTSVKEKWEGRRVRKTTENEYNIVVGNKETLVQESLKIEVANNTTSGISNNEFHTTGNNMFIAVGFAPRTTTDGERVIKSKIARYQNDEFIWNNAENKLLQIMDKKVLPEKQQANFITDVANNVQLHIGWSYTYARELDEHSKKNYYIELANNQVTTIGWIPRNNERGDGESRQLSDIEVVSQYIDVKNNSLLNIGWKPLDDARNITKTDVANRYEDIRNNSFTTVGWKPVDEARQVTDNDVTNSYLDIKNNQLSLVGWKPASESRTEYGTANHITDVKNNTYLNVGYDPAGSDARQASDDDAFNYYVDVKNNASHTTQNNFYLSVGNLPADERKRGNEERGLYIDVSNEWVTRVGTDMALDVRGNQTLNTIGNTFWDMHGAATFNSRNEFTVKSEVGVTFDTPSVSILGPLFVRDGMGTKIGVSDTFTALNGKVVTVTNGVITGIE